jgi:hypothetical protein
MLWSPFTVSRTWEVDELVRRIREGGAKYMKFGVVQRLDEGLCKAYQDEFHVFFPKRERVASAMNLDRY